MLRSLGPVEKVKSRPVSVCAQVSVEDWSLLCYLLHFCQSFNNCILRKTEYMFPTYLQVYDNNII